MLSRQPLFRMLLVPGVVGVALGIVYTLSPLTVVFFAGVALLISVGGRGLETSERHWVVGLLVAAGTLRLVAVGTLFLLTDHDREPFFTIFGDENLARIKALWMRNAVWGIPGAPEDVINAFDAYGQSAFVYVAAALQLLVGSAPYGLRLLNALIFLTSAVILYRITRTELGQEPAFVVLVILLFLPSLFIWSITTLKEPSYYLLNALVVALTLHAIRARTWRRGSPAAATAILLLWLIRLLRPGAGLISGASLVGGCLGWVFARKPRLLAAGTLALMLVTWPILTREPTRSHALRQVQTLAYRHWGHAAARDGHGYKLLDERLYAMGADGPLTMNEGQALRFVVRGVMSFITVPWPWQAHSLTERIFIPQQMLWYMLVVFSTIGLVKGLQQHAIFTSILASNIAVGSLILSLTNGNIGTLVRLRDMVTPLLVVLAGFGICIVGRWVAHARLTVHTQTETLRSVVTATVDRDPRPPSEASVFSRPPESGSRGIAAPLSTVARSAWRDSLTHTVLSGSRTCHIVGRAIGDTAQVLWSGRSHDQPTQDFSDVTTLVRQQPLVKRFRTCFLVVRTWWSSSYCDRTLTVLHRQWADRPLSDRISLLGGTAAVAAGCHAFLLRFSSVPPPLGFAVAALSGGLAIVSALGSHGIARAWLDRRTSQG